MIVSVDPGRDVATWTEVRNANRGAAATAVKRGAVTGPGARVRGLGPPRRRLTEQGGPGSGLVGEAVRGDVALEPGVGDQPHDGDRHERRHTNSGWTNASPIPSA